MSSDDSASRQRLLPLFVLALALTATGFWFVFAPDGRAGSTADALPTPFLRQLQPPETTPSDPVSLQYSATDRTYFVDLRQQRESADGDITRTRLRVGVDDRLSAAGPPMEFERRFRDPEVQFASADGALGAAVTGEVERLIATAIENVEQDVTGEVVGSTLVSTETAQLRQLLALLGNAVEVLQPRVPREAVRQGEEWTWSAPFHSVDAADALIDDTAARIEGDTRFAAEVAGATGEATVLISLRLEHRASGRVTDDEREVVFERAGDGTGWAEWDTASDRLLRSRIRYRQTATVDGQSVTSEYGLDLKAAAAASE